MTTQEPLPGRRSPLQTVDRALRVLLSFSERRTDWGVSELAADFGLDKSAAQRILAALSAQGFLRADPYTRRYSLGPAMWRMATHWERTGGLARLVDPVVAHLADDTDRAAAFAVPDGAYVRCIAAANGSDGPLRAQALVGDLYPAHAGATARAYFAFLDRHERRSLLLGRPVARFTEQTEVDHQVLERGYTETEELGYALSEGEYDANTRALAVPVLLGRRVVGSLTLGESATGQAHGELLEQLPRLQTAAQELSDLLASRNPARRPSRSTATHLEENR
ncbi:MAG: IclR family transcriptional regulator [Propionibacteriaceae bacterium]